MLIAKSFQQQYISPKSKAVWVISIQIRSPPSPHLTCIPHDCSPLIPPHPHAYLTAAGSLHSWPSVFPEIFNCQASQAERSCRLARPWPEGQPWGILSIIWIGQVCMSDGQMALPSSRILTCLDPNEGRKYKSLRTSYQRVPWQRVLWACVTSGQLMTRLSNANFFYSPIFSTYRVCVWSRWVGKGGRAGK